MVFFFFLFFIFLFFFLNLLLSFKLSGFAGLSSFESGFQSIGLVQVSFSLQFFLILLLFVVFDLEIVLLLGLLFTGEFSLISGFLVFFFVFGGLYLEWFFNKLSWSM